VKRKKLKLKNKKMNIFEWFKKKRKKTEKKSTEVNSEKVAEKNEENLFDNAPFLSPWYFAPEKPNLKTPSSQLVWGFVEKRDEEYLGIITLCRGETILGLLDMYTNVKPLSSGEEFCIWGGTEKIEGKISQALEIYSTENLREIDNSLEKMKNLRANKEAFYQFDSTPISKTTITLSPEQEVINHIFPPEFKVYYEIILVLNIPELYKEKEKGWQDCALVSLKPNENKIEIYPQDWFNQDTQMDFGYQWITRAFRDANTGSIFIEGIRLARYELDETNRRIKRILR
jgi:hypothetical protein